jgi:hypothetical protein
MATGHVLVEGDLDKTETPRGVTGVTPRPVRCRQDSEDPTRWHVASAKATGERPWEDRAYERGGALMEPWRRRRSRGERALASSNRGTGGNGLAWGRSP